MIQRIAFSKLTTKQLDQVARTFPPERANLYVYVFSNGKLVGRVKGR